MFHDKIRYWFHDSITVTIQAGSRLFSFDVDLKKLAVFVMRFFLIFFLLLVGTLMFFSETQLTQNLRKQVDKLEWEKATITIANAGVTGYPDTNAHGTAGVLKTTSASLPSPMAEASHESGSQAKISEFFVECTTTQCITKLTLLPTGSAAANGALLVLLELEMRQIGTGNPLRSNRRRFITYPDNEIKDDLTENSMMSLPRKSFHFSKALQPLVTFPITSWTRPLAVHLYLFDTKNNLIRHERREIAFQE